MDPPTISAAAPSTGKKKASRTRTKAMKQFDSSAPPMSLDKYFSDFQEIKRNNVSVELDPTLLDRISVPYLDRASDFADAHLMEETHAKDNLIYATHGLVGLGLVRKLYKSAPASVLPNLGFFKFISDVDLFLPPALSSALDNLGKISSDQFTIRVEYVEQDILRNSLRLLKTMSRHTQFQARYDPPRRVGEANTISTWALLDVEKIVFASESSARWLRELGKTFLAETAYRTFTATVEVENVEYQVQATFPQLRLSSSRSAQLDNIVEWQALMNPALPGAYLLGAAAISQIWTATFFKNPERLISNLEPSLRDTWLGDISVEVLLGHLGVNLISTSPGRRDLDKSRFWMQFLRDVHDYLSGHGKVTFDKFLKLAKQPDTQFGSLAQMMELDEKAWIVGRARGIEDFVFQNQGPNMSATSLVKINDKSAVVSGLLFGFSKRVWFSNSQSARLNGAISSARTSYLATDFLNNL
jgi:hypothetical protein